MILTIPLCVLILFSAYQSFIFPFFVNFILLFTLQIFVGGLDPNVTENVLKQAFSPYGEVIHVKIPVGKRHGFVQFVTRLAIFTCLFR
jgi:hypothetical protein